MSADTASSLPDSKAVLLTRGMQSALAGLALYGLATLQLGMAANGALTLAATLLPGLLRREFGYSMRPKLVLWLTVAVFLHSFGALGPYTQYPWYDEVTHTVSATLIAGVGYASFRAIEIHTDHVDAPPEFRSVFVVVFVLAAGVVWEIAEFASGSIASAVGVRAPLVVFGVDDIVSDMVFNTVGAVLVAVWGTGYFDGLVAFLGRQLRSGSER